MVSAACVYREYHALAAYSESIAALTDQLSREQHIIEQLEEQFRETKVTLEHQIANLRRLNQIDSDTNAGKRKDL